MVVRADRRRAVLVDRDGTVCEEVGYVDSPEQLRLIPRSAEAIAAAAAAGYQVVLVTNQGGIARGLLDEERLAEIHDHLRELLGEHGARLDGIYYCPHHPDGDHPRYGVRCGCRKPAPGLLFRARDEMGIDLERSFMIGDDARDVEAGASAGVTPILVATGHGQVQRDDPATRERLASVHLAADLEHAVDWILRREPPEPV
ncbi:MAG TPA: D-glycero-beta-D-manno-heptose 1,7-bisphosphate 7-phosphatase [Candidatus Polarisedimenticolaceae bacterium]|nr:D-glycero-beta-D-manno-heptose 1,7-bisphosphate 7-phosphatase [Candidatus Polarisedimenticolaceae bacterium]